MREAAKLPQSFKFAHVHATLRVMRALWSAQRLSRANTSPSCAELCCAAQDSHANSRAVEAPVPALGDHARLRVALAAVRLVVCWPC